jgi:poly(hydroxyalkanoate) granule-associated protein
MDKSLPKKIWLAGLGAIARAEKEGDDWLKELMEEGSHFEQDKKDELDQVLLSLNEAFKENQGKIREKFGNIENSFETKVSSALGRIGLVSKDELDDLKARLETIEKNLQAQESE